MQLRYGTNPHQKYAAAEPVDGAHMPLEVKNGHPSLINLLDALNAWQLVRELRGALGLPAAASFKHVSPAGAAVAVPLEPDLERAYEVAGATLTPSALAYVRCGALTPARPRASSRSPTKRPSRGNGPLCAVGSKSAREPQRHTDEGKPERPRLRDDLERGHYMPDGRGMGIWRTSVEVRSMRSKSVSARMNPCGSPGGSSS